MLPEDIYELVNAGDPRISPDGSRVAFVVTAIDREANEYRGAVWVAPLDGSAEPRRFTSGERRDTTPRWSPDGKWLAFASNRGDDKTPMNLYVIPAEGGEARKLTDLKESVEEIVWSPDSTRIAFVARVRDTAYEEEDDKKRLPRRFTRAFHKLDSVGFTGDRRTHLFVVELDGGEPRQLTHGDFEHGGAAWSPDGKHIVIGGLRDERWDVELINRLYSVDVDGDAEPKALTGDDGSYGDPSFSPDGSRIAYRWTPEDGTSPHHSQLGVMNADGSDQKLLTTSLDLQCGPYPDSRDPVWDGDRIVFAVEDGGNIHLYTVAADGSSEPERILDGERVISAFDLRDGKLAFVASTSHDDARALRRHRRPASHERRRRLHGWSPARAGRTLHRGLRRRLRGRRVDRPAGRLRSGQALPRGADDPRRTVLAVQHRASSTRCRSTAAAATSCSSRIRAAAPATRRSTLARSAGP